MKTQTSTRPWFSKRANLCKFCREHVNLDAEGTQYPDGTCAHECCDDAETFARDNAGDFEIGGVR